MSNSVTASVERLGTSINVSATTLTQAFFKNYPLEAARKLEALSPDDAATILISQTEIIREGVWACITPAAGQQILPLTSTAIALELLAGMDAGPCATLLSQLDDNQRDLYLQLMDETIADEMRELMDYPSNCAGYMMNARALTFNKGLTVSEAMAQLKRHPPITRRHIYTLDSELCLHGQIELENLVVAEPDQTLEELSHSVSVFVSPLDPKEDVADKLQKNAINSLPVIDIHHRLLGVIRGALAIETVKENIAADLQAMVGASREEKALSSSWFAVKKRQPWLQINLLTGFLAASIVGLFEGTISQFTALAVLMPVVAGQSGNTGAQALAVTMRGLTLREITIRHWFRVLFKEASSGLINGVGIAITCAAGVYIWSKSTGLALIIALSMVISMSIAGIAGALVPICLKKLGQDPAQSSSIILTTVTDVAGFMSFLGIATLLSGFI